MDSYEIGKKIKALREKRKMSKNALANAAGVSPTYVHQLEKGEKCPTVEYLGYICWGLGISLPEFFADENKGEKKEEKITADTLSEKQKKLLTAFIVSLLD